MAREFNGKIPFVPIDADTSKADKKVDALFNKIDGLKHIDIDANISNLQRKLETMAKRTNEQLTSGLMGNMVKDFRTVLGAMKTEAENNGIDTVIYKSLEKTTKIIEDRFENITISVGKKQFSGLEQILNNVSELDTITDFKFGAIVSKQDITNSDKIVKNIKETKKELNSIVGKIEYIGTVLKKDTESTLSDQKLKNYKQKVLDLQDVLKAFSDIDSPLIQGTVTEAAVKAADVLNRISQKQAIATKKQAEGQNSLAQSYASTTKSLEKRLKLTKRIDDGGQKNQEGQYVTDDGLFEIDRDAEGWKVHRRNAQGLYEYVGAYRTLNDIRADSVLISEQETRAQENLAAAQEKVLESKAQTVTIQEANINATKKFLETLKQLHEQNKKIDKVDWTKRASGMYDTKDQRFSVLQSGKYWNLYDYEENRHDPNSDNFITAYNTFKEAKAYVIEQLNSEVDEVNQLFDFVNDYINKHGERAFYTQFSNMLGSNAKPVLPTTANLYYRNLNDAMNPPTVVSDLMETEKQVEAIERATEAQQDFNAAKNAAWDRRDSLTAEYETVSDELDTLERKYHNVLGLVNDWRRLNNDIGKVSGKNKRNNIIQMLSDIKPELAILIGDSFADGLSKGFKGIKTEDIVSMVSSIENMNLLGGIDEVLDILDNVDFNNIDISAFEEVKGRFGFSDQAIAFVEEIVQKRQQQLEITQKLADAQWDLFDAMGAETAHANSLLTPDDLARIDAERKAWLEAGNERRRQREEERKFRLADTEEGLYAQLKALENAKDWNDENLDIGAQEEWWQYLEVLDALTSKAENVQAAFRILQDLAWAPESEIQLAGADGAALGLIEKILGGNLPYQFYEYVDKMLGGNEGAIRTLCEQIAQNIIGDSEVIQQRHTELEKQLKELEDLGSYYDRLGSDREDYLWDTRWISETSRNELEDDPIYSQISAEGMKAWQAAEAVHNLLVDLDEVSVQFSPITIDKATFQQQVVEALGDPIQIPAKIEFDIKAPVDSIKEAVKQVDDEAEALVKLLNDVSSGKQFAPKDLTLFFYGYEQYEKVLTSILKMEEQLSGLDSSRADVGIAQKYLNDKKAEVGRDISYAIQHGVTPLNRDVSLPSVDDSEYPYKMLQMWKDAKEDALDNKLKFADGTMLDEKEVAAVEKYCSVLKKLMGDTYKEAMALANALDLVFNIKHGNVEELMGIFNAGNKASNSVLKLMTGMDVNNQKNRDAAFRSINPEAYDKLIQDQTDAAKQAMDSQRSEFQQKWDELVQVMLGGDAFKDESNRTKGQILKSFGSYGKSATEAMDEVNQAWLKGELDGKEFKSKWIQRYVDYLNEQQEYYDSMRNAQAGDVDVDALFGGSTDRLTEEKAAEQRAEVARWDELIAKKKEYYGITPPIIEATPKLEEQVPATESIVQLVDDYGSKLDEVNNKLMQGTKLLNEQGEVLRLFHNSPEIFDAFDMSKAGSNQGQALGLGNYLALRQDGEFNELAYGRYQTQWYANVQNPFKAGDKLTSEQASAVIDKFMADKAEGFKNHMLSKLLDGDVITAIKDIAEIAKTTIGDVFGHIGYDAVRDGAQINIFDPSKIHRANDSVLDIGTKEFEDFRALQEEIWKERSIIADAESRIKDLSNEYSGKTKEQLDYDLFTETLFKGWKWHNNVAKIGSAFKELTGKLPESEEVSPESMRALVENYEFSAQAISHWQSEVEAHTKILDGLTAKFDTQKKSIDAKTMSYLTDGISGIVNPEVPVTPVVEPTAVQEEVVESIGNKPIEVPIEPVVSEDQPLSSQIFDALKQIRDLENKLRDNDYSDESAKQKMDNMREIRASISEIERKKFPYISKAFRDEDFNPSDASIDWATTDGTLREMAESIAVYATTAKDELGELKLIKIDTSDAELLNGELKSICDNAGNAVDVYRGLANEAQSNKVLTLGHSTGATWFTTQKDVAEGYTRGTDNLYRANLQSRKLLEIDANHSRWNDITFLGDGSDDVSKTITELYHKKKKLKEETTKLAEANQMESQSYKDANAALRRASADYEYYSNRFDTPYGTHDTNWYAEYAKANGYDAFRIRNVYDTLQGGGLSDVIGVFSDQQIINIEKIAKTVESVENKPVEVPVKLVVQESETVKDIGTQIQEEVQAEQQLLDTAQQVTQEMGSQAVAASKIADGIERQEDATDKLEDDIDYDDTGDDEQEEKLRIIQKSVDDALAQLNRANPNKNEMIDLSNLESKEDLQNRIGNFVNKAFGADLSVGEVVLDDDIAKIGLYNEKLGITTQQVWQLKKATEDATEANLEFIKADPLKLNLKQAQKYAESQKQKVDQSNSWITGKLGVLNTKERAYKYSNKKISGDTQIENFDGTAEQHVDKTLDSLTEHIRNRLQNATGSIITGEFKNAIENDLRILENEYKIQQYKEYASTTMTPTEIGEARKQFEYMLNSLESKAKKNNVFDSVSESLKTLREQVTNPEVEGYLTDGQAVSGFVDKLRTVKAELNAAIADEGLAKKEQQDLKNALNLQEKLYTAKKKLAKLEVQGKKDTSAGMEAQRKVEEAEEEYKAVEKLIQAEESKQKLEAQRTKMQAELAKVSEEEANIKFEASGEATANENAQKIKSTYDSILNTINKINSIDKDLMDLGNKNELGVYDKLIMQLKAEKEALVNQLRDTLSSAGDTYGNGVLYGDQSVSGARYFSEDDINNLNAFIQGVGLGTEEINKLNAAFMQSDKIGSDAMNKIIASMNNVQTAARGVFAFDESGNVVNTQNGMAMGSSAFGQAFNAYVEYQREMQKLSQQDVIGANTAGIEAAEKKFLQYAQALGLVIQKEQEYFAGRRKYDGGGANELAIVDEASANRAKEVYDREKKLREQAQKFAKESDATGAIITGFTQGVDGIAKLDFSYLEEGTNTIRKFRMEMDSAGNIYYPIETTVDNFVSKQKVANDQLEKANTLIKNAKAAGGDNDAINRLTAARDKLNAELSKPDGGDAGVLSGYITEAKLAAAEVEKLYKKHLQLESLKENEGAFAKSINLNADIYKQMTESAQEYITANNGVNAKIGKFNNTTNQLKFSFETADGVVKEFTMSLDLLGKQCVAQQGSVTQLKTKWEQFKDGVSGTAKQFMTAFAGMNIFYEIIAQLRQGYQYVKEIDTALTELKKVTNESELGYQNFLGTMSQYGREVSSTISELTTSAADWARLGYSMQEAGELAKNTSILMNVSEFDNVSEATDTLISALQAYKDEGTDVTTLSMQIIDAYNTVGNKFAISTSDLANSLTRSSAALVAANNDLAQSIALTTAANTTIQDPEAVGNALKVVSMRIRGVKSELEAAGEDTEGVVENTAKLQDKVMALTNIDGTGGINILTQSGEFKSTYDILLEISRVWDRLSDTSQASLLETLAGKTRGSVVAGLLQNGDILEEAYNAVQTSGGSSQEELMKYMDSIEGKTQQLTNALQAMWSNALSSDFIKFLLDAGKVIVEIIDKLGVFNTAIVAFFGAKAFTAKDNTLFDFLKIVSGDNKKLELNTNSAIGKVFAGIKTGEIKSFGAAFKGLGSSINLAAIKAGVLNTALSVMGSLAIVGIISGIAAGINYLATAEERAAEAARNAVVASAEMQERASSLDAYKQQITSLRAELDSNTLSETEAYSAREQLLAIESELIDKFGLEADGINLVTGAIEDQIAAIDKLSQADAQKWLNENQKAINGAIEYFDDKNRGGQLDGFWEGEMTSITNWGSTERISNMIDEYAQSRDHITTSTVGEIGQDIDFTGSVEEVKKEVEDFQDWLAIKEKELVKEKTALLSLPDQSDEVKKQVESLEADIAQLQDVREDIGTEYVNWFGTDSLYASNKALIEQTQKNTALTQYADQYMAILDAENALIDAQKRGDEDGIREALNALNEATAAASTDAATNGQNYMVNFFNGIQSGYEQMANEFKLEDDIINNVVFGAAGSYLADTVSDILSELDGMNAAEIIQLGNIDPSNSAFVELTQLANRYKLSVEDLLGVLSRLGYVEAGFKTDIPDFTSASVVDYADSITLINDNISSYKSALDSLEAGTFTMTDFIALIEKFPDLAEGVDISSKSFTGLSKNLRMAIKNSPDDLVDDLKELSKRLQDAGKSTDSIDGLIDYLEDLPTDSIDDLVGKFGDLEDKINAATRAQLGLKEAMSENPNAGYETRGEALKYIKDKMSRGEIGSQSEVWSVAEEYGFKYDNTQSTNYNADELAKYVAARDRWYKEGEDGSYSYDGIKNFMQDVEAAVGQSKELRKLMQWDYDETTGTFKMDFNNSDWDTIVGYLSETDRLTQLTSEEFADLLMQIGQFHDINWSNAEDLTSYIQKIADGSGDASTKMDVMTKSVEKYVEKALGKDVDFSSLTLENLDGLGELSEEMRTLLETYINLRNQLEDPLGIKTTIQGEDPISALLEIEELQGVIRQNSDGTTFIDTDAFTEVMKEAGYTKDEIQALIDVIKEYKSVVTTTESDPLGLNSSNKSLNTVMSSLRELGVEYQVTQQQFGNPVSMSINVPSLVQTLSDKGWTSSEIYNYLQTISSGEHGLGITLGGVDGSITLDTINTILNEKKKMSEPETLTVDIAGTAPSSINAMKVQLDELTGKQHQIDVIINRKGSLPSLPSSASPSGIVGVNGTAHATGSWGAPATETALVGELGPEMLVRNGRWTTVGNNGAEFTQVRRGDIIFNHKQTQDLLSKGYVTGRGKLHGGAFASGTAYMDGDSDFGRYTFDGKGGWSEYDVNNKLVDSANGLAAAANALADSTDEFKEVFDWIEIRIEELDETLALLESQIENAISYSDKNTIIDDLIQTNKTKLDNLEAGYEKYAEFAAELLTKVPEQYREAVQNGAIDIEAFVGETNETTLEAINNYREWAQKAADFKQQANEILTTIRDLAIQKFDNAYEAGDVKATVEDSQTEKLQNAVDYDEERGLITSDAYYIAMMENSNKKIEYLTDARKAMQKELDAAVKAGQIERGSNEWYELLDQMYQVDAQIDEATIELEEFQNAINDIYWENFDQLISRIDYLKDETQSLIDLMSHDDLVVDPVKRKYENGTVEYWTADDVDWTDEGLASLGLYAQQMEIAEYRARQYSEAIDDLTKEYNAGHYSENEYYEKLNELKDAQYESIEAYYDAQDAIKDLNETRIDSIKEGIEKEIEAYEELIDAKKELLDSEKDAHDFQKTVLEQQKNISDIERKLAALAYDNSASARAQRAKLEAELAEARAELDETYYDRSIEEQQNALDKELENFQKEKDAEVTKMEEYLEDIKQVVADSLLVVQGNASGIYDTLAGKAEEYNLTLSDYIMTPWQDGSLAVSGYQETFDTAMSSTMDQLDALKNKWQEVIDTMVEAGNAHVEAINKENINYAAAEKPKQTTAPQSTNSQATTTKQEEKSNVRTEQDYYGVALATLYGSYGWGNGADRIRQYQEKGLDYNKAQGIVNQLWSEGLVHNGTWEGKYYGITKKDLDKYHYNKFAKGTKGVPKDQLAIIDELGEELQLVPDGNGRLAYLTKGTSVIPADITENLMEWGTLDPADMLERNRPQINASPSVINNTTEIHIDASVGELLHVEQLNGNNPAELTKVIDKAWDKRMKELNGYIRRYTNR